MPENKNDLHRREMYRAMVRYALQFAEQFQKEGWRETQHIRWAEMEEWACRTYNERLFEEVGSTMQMLIDKYRDVAEKDWRENHNLETVAMASIDHEQVKED